MSTVEYFLQKFRDKFRNRNTPVLGCGSSALAVAACGGGERGSDIQVKGFPSSYVGPSSNFVAPNESDLNFEILKPVYIDPYWVSSLEMDQWQSQIIPMLEDFDRIIEFTFPETPPQYDIYDLTGWGPATEEMKKATREILIKLEDILDITLNETDDPRATNVISVATSSQTTTAGFSYFPNNFFEIGMDVFLAKEYVSPSFISESVTNYEYEVLVHEIGHALGLKHPFEAAGANNMILSAYEDNTQNTTMSYTHNLETFNGTLRPLDWMTLSKFYGVKSTYRAADDTYNFSNLEGTFILDGAGIDTINAFDTSLDVTIDLRPGTHSHLGVKSTYITAANQLTISHYSDIENVITGAGHDTVIGTSLDNVILTGGGSDTIFAGGGADTIRSGVGADHIDLSEAMNAKDIVILDAPSTDLGIDTIYGFVQGATGDTFDVSAILNSHFELFPIVARGSAPNAYFDDGILRLIGSNIATATEVSEAFKMGGGFETLSISSGASALIISAESQSTGEDQFVFVAESDRGDILITQLAVLHGNALDIDQWHTDNFSIFA